MRAVFARAARPSRRRGVRRREVFFAQFDGGRRSRPSGGDLHLNSRTDRPVGSTGREQPASIAGIRQVASGCDATCDAISTDRIELLAHAERGAGMSAEVDASTGAPTHR